MTRLMHFLLSMTRLMHFLLSNLSDADEFDQSLIWVPVGAIEVVQWRVDVHGRAEQEAYVKAMSRIKASGDMIVEGVELSQMGNPDNGAQQAAALMGIYRLTAEQCAGRPVYKRHMAAHAGQNSRSNAGTEKIDAMCLYHHQDGTRKR
jgi:hypothetical protein